MSSKGLEGGLGLGGGISRRKSFSCPTNHLMFSQTYVFSDIPMRLPYRRAHWTCDNFVEATTILSNDITT